MRGLQLKHSRPPCGRERRVHLKLYKHGKISKKIRREREFISPKPREGIKMVSKQTTFNQSKN